MCNELNTRRLNKISVKIFFIAGPYAGDGPPETIESNIRTMENYQVALTNLKVDCSCPYNRVAHLSSNGSVENEDFFYILDFIAKEHC
jgi:hypothetical protein